MSSYASGSKCAPELAPHDKEKRIAEGNGRGTCEKQGETVAPLAIEQGERNDQGS